MHDCPTCKVPLHGYEEVCPACGTRQVVRRRYSNLAHVQQAPGINWGPVIAVIVVAGIGVALLAQSTWVGELMKQGPRQEDPLAKLTPLDARTTIESKITEGLTAAGARGTFTWQNADGSPTDKRSAQPLMLNIETKLSNPALRKQIIDPVKPYMPKANLTTLTMTDTKSNATWTYTVQQPAPSSTSDAPAEGENPQGGAPD